MPETSSFRQVEEKHVSAEVDHMVWSPKMDLLAVANVQGEVVLHRLSWQKVWSLAPPLEDIKVTSLAWRPDGKVLSVGYNNGIIILCDIENASNLHKLQVSSMVTSLTWLSENVPETQDEKDMCFQEESQHYLPKLPQFAKSYSTLNKGQTEENVEDSKKLKGQTELNLMIVGSEEGKLFIYAYGVFPIGVIDLNHHGTGKSGQILSGYLSHDLYMITLLMENLREDGENKDVYLVSFDTSLLALRCSELRILALKFGHILTLMSYLESTIQQMSEAWEDILLEMDSKLMKFAEQKKQTKSGSVSNDLLQLLMFGTPSEELKSFLLFELTDKGLKKLGHSIETSYSNIQKLVLKHLQSVGQAIQYHLSDLRGMSMWFDKFGVLGLTTEIVQDAIAATGAFMLKASELQQVIDGSMKNFKAFFRWLYVVILRLSDEPIPPELSKMTQQDLNFVAQFLKENFTEEYDESKSGFKLEKVGQYLKNESLRDPPENKGNMWVEFLEQNPTLKESPHLYPAKPEKSLIQMHAYLVEGIEATYNKCASVIGQSLHCVSTYSLFGPQIEEEDGFKPKISQITKQINKEEVYLYTVLTTEAAPCDKCYILRQQSRGDRTFEVVGIKFGQLGQADPDESTGSVKCSSHKILDIEFYDQDTLSVLLVEDQEDGLPVLVQVPLSCLEVQDYHKTISENTTLPLLSEDMKAIDVGQFVDSMNYRRLENMKASKFAVSGTRKAACVLFSSRRRVRLFLMDVEEEEDDEEEDEGDVTADSVKNTDDSLQNASCVDEEEEDKENTSKESSEVMDL